MNATTDLTQAPDAENDPIAEQAAEWVVLLSSASGKARSKIESEFSAWQQQDPRHSAQAKRLEGTLARIQLLAEGGSARVALNAASKAGKAARRPSAKKMTALTGIAIIGGAAWLLSSTYPPAYLLADVRTTSGEWRTQTLEDGSEVTLGSDSAIDIHFDGTQRHVQLVRGEIKVTVAKDAARPFTVESAQGRIRALGTQFLVRQEEDATGLAMIESRTAVSSTKSSAPATIVSEGERVRITEDGVSPVETLDTRTLNDAWQRHRLVVDDMPLSAVLDELARHRRGGLHYNAAELTDIRVSAVLPLDDTDRALGLLASKFPQLKVRTLTPYLVWVSAGKHP